MTHFPDIGLTHTPTSSPRNRGVPRRDVFAVYGTLRVGEGNATLWEGLADHQRGVLLDFQLYLPQHAGFPIVLPQLGARTVVDVLMPVTVEAFDILAGRLDALEGVPRLYKRDRGNVVIGEGVIWETFLYTPASTTLIDGSQPIESGDWSNDYGRNSPRGKARRYGHLRPVN